MIKNILILATIFSFFICEGYSQNNKKASVQDLSYKELKSGFFKEFENDSIANIYSNQFLNKAKNELDTIKMAEGYLFKSYKSDFEEAIMYSDSIINLTIDQRNYYYPALGFMIKGFYLYNEGYDKKALDQYLEADKHAVFNDNFKQQIEIKQFIGGLKYNFGDYREALKIFKSQLNFIKNQKDYKQVYIEDYLIALDDLSKSYLRGKQVDSALIYTKEGLLESKRVEDLTRYNRFLLTSGICFFYKNNHKKALDSLNKLEPRIKDLNRLAMCYYYMAKVYQEIDFDKSILNFKKVDSLYQITKNPFIELRDVYKSLYNYYSINDEEKSQLINLKKLITIDSILDLNHNYTETEIIKNYDIPKLKEEKLKLELTIKNNKTKRNFIYSILVLFILLAVILVVKFYKDQKKYKIRFEAIMKENMVSESHNEDEKANIYDLNISDDIITEVLEGLELFEKNKRFIENGLTLNKVSKSLNTNTSYLSKIINTYKGVSFSSYLNRLRISYAINELKGNPKFRNYTIQAIAREVGFNTAESFSKAFYKEKGIYPSYFVKELNKS
ncbi:AraC-like DNA-binding protein [Mesoflavibacter sabulilitoris]|uniref:HTH araC/xylS-type domain-containing protein n=1 Tax=Mesoflavibacter zeaxanthinifaciens subsp. sabulilitoris TaxID=1520893 RepID=A0A2T1N5Y0_9FLAO|nr:helix-turn-helix transcriptional regulator [Mesoflavibacter zeaxanthinifaciens]MBB3123377.1 AraC-like DNA-binding protein [Mesoflavibacter zeaxanthinifaciens subsp. sabulilitoris]PSG86991.1 hypothetical protein C7H61_12840 [Mesoflavibacter zeaxanthinifaciens subsp. sabulilitoris]